MKKQHLGTILLIFTAMIWGTAFVGQRVGMETIEPFTFNAARMLLAAVVVGIVAIILSKKREAEAPLSPSDKKTRRRSTLLGGLCCGLFLAAASSFQQVGLIYTSAGKAGFITAMYMLLVPIISFVVFRKKHSVQVWLAVVIGVAGLYLLCVTDGFSLTRGDTLVCICALLFSCHILCCDHFVKTGDPVAISAIQFAVVAVICTVIALVVETPTLEKLLSAAIPIAYCGIISGGVGYTLQIVAQGFTEPAVASLLMSLESVFAVLAGALLLNERMTPRELFGCVVMFAAIILVQIPISRRRKSAA